MTITIPAPPTTIPRMAKNTSESMLEAPKTFSDMMAKPASTSTVPNKRRAVMPVKYFGRKSDRKSIMLAVIDFKFYETVAAGGNVVLYLLDMLRVDYQAVFGLHRNLIRVGHGFIDC